MKLFVLLLFVSSLAHGTETIKKISEVKSGEVTKLIVSLSGDLLENPKINKTKSMIEFFIPGVKKNSTTSIHINPYHGIKVKDSSKGTIISIPRKVIKKSNISDVSIKLSKKSLTAILPLVKVQAKKLITKTKKTIEKKDVQKVDKSNLDYLIEDFRKTTDTHEPIPFNEDRVNVLLEDKVKAEQAAQSKGEVVSSTKSEAIKIDDLNDETKGFQSYLLKLVMVLTGIIGVFLLVMNLFRKKVLGKNKMGFLNNSKLVEVVGTTHIAPKKNLLLVRVHDQFLLLSNTDGGINFLSEIKDQAGLLRMGEKEILGTNFDGNLQQSNSVEPTTIVEKKNIYESTPTSSKQSSFSKHFKKKLTKSRSVERRV